MNSDQLLRFLVTLLVTLQDFKAWKRIYSFDDRLERAAVRVIGISERKVFDSRW